jgi:Spy/CpxP family protein refolding chaperone
MKKVILFAACLFTLSTAVNAQETARKPKTEKAVKENLTPEQRAQKNVDNLNAVAGLTDEQKTKVKDLATTRITKADAIRAKYKGQAENKETMQNEIAAARKDYRQSVKALLTPEQIEKVKAKKKEVKSGKDTENVIDAND